MSNYLYFQHELQRLNNRFNLEGIDEEGYAINGLEDWQLLIGRLLELLSVQEERNSKAEQTIRDLTVKELDALEPNPSPASYDSPELPFGNRSTGELIAILLLARLKRQYKPFPANHCPRLFISHRQIDKNYALRIAQMAAQNKFAYWVDVLDPNLRALQHKGVPEKLVPLVTACIIEMGLINCTHVIACMTPDTRGSLWLPYEYGRITELPGVSRRAAAWLHPNLDRKDFPEYMLLGELTATEKEIGAWLAAEWRLAGKSHCKAAGGDLLAGHAVEMLPEASDDELEKTRQAVEDHLARGMPLDRDIHLAYSPQFKDKRPS